MTSPSPHASDAGNRPGTVLSTDRLDLRRFGPADADFIVELLNEPSWIAHIGDRGVRTPEEAAAWIEARLVAHYHERGFGFWAVERRSDRALLGLCGLIQRDNLPEVDLGYAFLARHWGQGHAREAAAACLRHAREALRLRRVLAITGPDNTASARVLEAVGMRQIDTRVLAGEEQPTRVYLWEA